MLIACNSLITQPALERRATDWIRWLVEGEAYTESQSYGEMPLLTAIHFHAGQLDPLAVLGCDKRVFWCGPLLSVVLSDFPPSSGPPEGETARAGRILTKRNPGLSPS